MNFKNPQLAGGGFWFFGRKIQTGGHIEAVTIKILYLRFNLLTVVIAAITIGSVFYGSKILASTTRPSFEIKNQALHNVAQKLSDIYGYKIELHTNFAHEKISGKFKNVDLAEAVALIFRDYNHFEVWDEQYKLLTLYVFKGDMPSTIITDKLPFEQTTKTISP